LSLINLGRGIGLQPVPKVLREEVGVGMTHSELIPHCPDHVAVTKGMGNRFCYIVA